MSHLAERLGYHAEDRLLLVNADDYGLCHSVNVAVQEMLVLGAVSSATVMMPCAWAYEAAKWSAHHPQYDVGVHLTFTSEWGPYRWGPVTRTGDVSSLVTAEGYFPSDSRSVEETADTAQLKQEMKNQIEMAISLGMSPTHADNHMGSLYGLQTGRHFLADVLDVCAEYGLPFRLPRYVLQENGSIAPPDMQEQARQVAALADAKGVVILDYLVGLPFALGDGETYDALKGEMIALLGNLHAGVTELIIHPSKVTDELRSFHREPEKRGMEHRLFMDEDIKKVLQKEGIRLIKWSELQSLQQRTKKSSQS
ncbi:polysaccharide deacetylase family protein [Paenibacillus chungangensis]|uniref:Polysaccharide deacetylase family protein n=1 Tax=Paenibacillus chungangensis TaxID=696535 RepID=A0ABW3HN78_9BACL